MFHLGDIIVNSDNVFTNPTIPRPAYKIIDAIKVNNIYRYTLQHIGSYKENCKTITHLTSSGTGRRYYNQKFTIYDFKVISSDYKSIQRKLPLWF